MTFTTRTVHIWAWLSLVANSVIIVSGALVRLTGSGLGCPTWPKCTEDSFVPHAALGHHGVIEFGNRLVTYLVAVAAIGVLIVLIRSAERTRLRFRLAIFVVLGVPLQAVIGGITVLTDLNPWIVSLHLVLSMAMVALATWLVLDLRRDYGSTDQVTSRLALASYVVLAGSVYLGTIVTGSGPHAGDAAALRNGLDPLLWSRIHALSVWLFVALLVVLLVRLAGQPGFRTTSLVFVLTLAQGGIGYLQHFTGLPIGLVLAHLVGATVLLAAATWMVAATTSQHDHHGALR